MGNNLSNEQGAGRPVSTFGKRGALGLSKQELDKRCAPSGLYPSCSWDAKAIRRLIGDGRLAARLKGSDTRSSSGEEQECPICFLHYSELNITQCCRANICTECFLQVRPQTSKHCVCPFCNNARFYVAVAKGLDEQQIAQRQEEEDRLFAARLRAQEEQEFGRSLQKDQERLRARGVSFDDPTPQNNSNSNNQHRNEADIQLLRDASLTQIDRQNIEEEMKAQHTHPLSIMMEQEAEQRRQANEREYYRNNSGRIREQALARMGGRSGRLYRVHNGGGSRRNWSDIVDAFEGGENGGATTLDDMVVMEAAIMLSMEEEEQRRRNQERENDGDGNQNSADAQEGYPMMSPFLEDDGGGGGGGRFRPELGGRAMAGAPSIGAANLLFGGVSEDEQVAMAIALSMQDQSEASNKEQEGDDNDEIERETEGGNEKETKDENDQDESEDPKVAEQSQNETSEDDDGDKKLPPRQPLEGAKSADLPDQETAAAVAASTAVAALPAGSVCDDGDDDDPSMDRRKDFQTGKFSQDDSEYFRQTGSTDGGDLKL